MDTITFHINKPRNFVAPMIYSTFEKEIGLLSVQLKRLRSEIRGIERKYGMNSREFYKKFEGGKLEDIQDFFLWASSIDIYNRLKEEYTLLKGLAKQCRA